VPSYVGVVCRWCLPYQSGRLYANLRHNWAQRWFEPYNVTGRRLNGNTANANKMNRVRGRNARQQQTQNNESDEVQRRRTQNYAVAGQRRSHRPGGRACGSEKRMPVTQEESRCHDAAATLTACRNSNSSSCSVRRETRRQANNGQARRVPHRHHGIRSAITRVNHACTAKRRQMLSAGSARGGTSR